MSTYRAAISKGKKDCIKCDVPSETVKVYMLEICQREGINLYMDYEEEMPVAIEEEFKAGMERILKHEPMQHVLGYSWFYGYKMLVSEEVLIPRVETEELCAYVLGEMDRVFVDYSEIVTADVGTGSAAIAITLAKEEPKVKMMASDISVTALEVAKKNAELNEANVEFFCGDMAQPLIDAGKKLDVLVCNPPYIPAEEVLEDSVKDFEPHVALFGGEDGLKFYRIVFEQCKALMKPVSFMAFEMGWNQREAMSALVEQMLPGCRYEIRKDMNGKDRMLFVYFNC